MICELCKVCNNPLKLEMLVRVHSAKDGVNVGILADEMFSRGLVLSGVSQYLKQLESLGVVRRYRAGRYVNYFPDLSRATADVRTVVEAIVARKGSLKPLAPCFAALMNPFRAKVVAALRKAGEISAVEICEKTEHQLRYLKRDLKAAEDAGLVWSDDSEPALAVYHYCEPSDPIARLLVELC